MEQNQVAYMCIHGVSKGEWERTTTEKILGKRGKMFQNLMKTINLWIQEVQWSPSRRKWKTTRHIIIKLLKRSEKEKERKIKGTLKAPREKNTTMQRGTKLGIIAHFPLEIIYTKRRVLSIKY